MPAEVENFSFYGCAVYKILLAGQDVRLLATRAAVLGRTTGRVVCCNAAEALKALEGEGFDLVVLCHSLAERDAVGITATVHRRWPQTRVLMVASDVSGERFYRGVEFDATSSPEPDNLVRHVAELLEELPDHRIEETMQLVHRQLVS